MKTTFVAGPRGGRAALGNRRQNPNQESVGIPPNVAGSRRTSGDHKCVTTWVVIPMSSRLDCGRCYKRASRERRRSKRRAFGLSATCAHTIGCIHGNWSIRTHTTARRQTLPVWRSGAFDFHQPHRRSRYVRIRPVRVKRNSRKIRPDIFRPGFGPGKASLQCRETNRPLRRIKRPLQCCVARAPFFMDWCPSTCEHNRYRYSMDSGAVDVRRYEAMELCP